MQAADFEIMLRKKLPLIFKNGQREIEGEVNLENEEIYPPSLSGIVFHGEVDLTGALVHGDLDFSNCTFVKRLDLCGITVSGTLFLNDAEVFGDGRLGDQPYIAVDATRAVINGDFEARPFVVAGSVSGNGAKFNGSIDLSGSHIEELDLQGADIGLDLRLDKMPNIKPEIQQIDARGLTVRGYLIIHWLGADSVDLSKSELRRESTIVDSTIHQDLLATGTRFNGGLRIRGVDVGGNLLLDTATIQGDLYIDPSGNNRPRVAGLFNSTGAHFNGNLWIYGIEVGGDLRLDSATIHGRFYLSTYEQYRPRVRGELQLNLLRGRPSVEIHALDNDGGIMVLSADVEQLRLLPALVKHPPNHADILSCRTGRLVLGAPRCKAISQQLYCKSMDPLILTICGVYR